MSFKPKITAFVVDGEIVSSFNALIGKQADGNIVSLKADYVKQIPGIEIDDMYRTYQKTNNHFMETVVTKMREQGFGKVKGGFTYPKTDFKLDLTPQPEVQDNTSTIKVN